MLHRHPSFTAACCGLALTLAAAGFAADPAADRRTGRPPELWQDYMHGIVDDFAHPADLKAVLSAHPELSRHVARGVRLETPRKSSDQPVFEVKGSGSVMLPLPIDPAAVRGRSIRFFFWMKARNAADDRGWHAPNIVFRAKDARGKVLYSIDSYLHTAGTFPWHCYYRDFFIPRTTAALEIKFYNMFRGNAWLTCPSWEALEPGGPAEYSPADRQDPVTGSLAANVRYDQMPEHLRELGPRYRWNFLKGGLPGQPFDITTKAGFRKYYFDKAKKCPEHMNHAILYLGLMYHGGTRDKLLPPMEAGWYDNFRDILMGDQDPATGYWHDGYALSLGLTFHLCNMFFRYYDLPRPDRADIVNPPMGLVKYVPRAPEIIRQTLRQQSGVTGPDGVRRPAAWSKDAYRYTLEPDRTADKAYLGSTWDAIYLLRLSARYADPELQRQVYRSVRGAFRYLLEKNVMPDGAWKQQDTDAHVTRYSYVYNIIGDSHWLERKIDPALPPPAATLRRVAPDRIAVNWDRPAAGQDSLRIYLVPAGTPPERIHEKHLAGIIQRTGHEFTAMDPFVGARKMVATAVRLFGPKMKLPPESTWQGQRYFPWKMRMLREPLPFTEDARPLTLTLPAGPSVEVWVGASDWYGEESAPVRLPQP